METAEKRVVETYIREDSKLIHLVVNGEEIVTTETHPFYVNKRGFVEAGGLKIGDELLDVDNNILLVEDYSVEITEAPTTVYNFQIEDFHTYFVGETSILVHNASNLYSRGSWRKSTDERIRKEAPMDADSDMICPTCGKKISQTITDKNGRVRIGYDRDHYPTTWSERVKAMKARPIAPTRKQVLNIFNQDVRVQCPECNQGHMFEGVKGDFAK